MRRFREEIPGGAAHHLAPRLREIRRWVKNSVRSHYERKNIERLFELQPRAAQALVQGISPSAKVRLSFLLARAGSERVVRDGCGVSDGDRESCLSPAPLPHPRTTAGCANVNSGIQTGVATTNVYPILRSCLPLSTCTSGT